MSTQENIKQDIINIIAGHVGADVSKISFNTHLESDLGIDSMSMVVLTMHLEPYLSARRAEIPVDYMQLFLGVETVGELIDIVLEG